MSLHEMPAGVPITVIEDSSNYLAQNGRPLDERSISVELFDRLIHTSPPIQFEEKSCTYNDIRKNFPDKPMNVSALKEINRNKQGILDGFAWINNRYYNGKPTSTSTALEMKELSGLAVSLPSYLVLRGENPIDESQISNVVGDLYKAGQGIYSAATYIMTEKSPNVHVDPEMIFTYVSTPTEEDQDILLVGSGEVCAAPKRLIIQSLHALLLGKEGKSNRSELKNLIQEEEFDTLYSYSLIYTTYNGLMEEYQTITLEMIAAFQDVQVIPGKIPVRILDIQDRRTELQDKICELQISFNQVLGRDETLTDFPSYEDLDNIVLGSLRKSLP